MGSPRQARILIGSILGFPLLLTLETPVSGSAGSSAERQGGGAHQGRDTCSLLMGCRPWAAASPRVSSGFWKWRFLF